MKRRIMNNNKHFKYRNLCIGLMGAALLCITDVAAYARPLPAEYQTEVGAYGMTPIYGQAIPDGTYEISVDSNSQYFKIPQATLTVKDGEMTGTITINSHSYSYVYLGTRGEAMDADKSDWVKAKTDGDASTYTFPVEALNMPFDCAAYSKKRQKWYDRTILFDAGSLPEGTLPFELPDYEAIESGLKALDEKQRAEAEGAESANEGEDVSVDPETDAELTDDGNAVESTEQDKSWDESGQKVTADGQTIYGGQNVDAYTPAEPVEPDLPDGEYSIEVSMAGGTGRATISSPTLMVIQDGKAYAKILWSSTYYDWMVAAGDTYYNENTNGGNSYFMIPITAMDTLVPVIADTTAMDDPVAIEYSLTFYEETIGNKGQIPQEAAKKVLIAALIVIVGGGILNLSLKKKNKRGKKGRK